MKNLHNIHRSRISLTKDQETVVTHHQFRGYRLRYNTLNKKVEQFHGGEWQPTYGTYHIWCKDYPEAKINYGLLEIYP